MVAPRHVLVTLAVMFAIMGVPRTVARYPGSDDPGKPALPPHSAYDPIRTAFPDYAWPTDARKKITSTFAEFRRTHFHGGIDVGTGSTTGFRVFASRDGYVAKIRVSPNGYGKMLFVRHEDGFYTTYAHLDRFNDAIQERVLREQLRLERYPVHIDCDPHEFPVKKGDLIAYTGETGSGSPHLHFEIRDPYLDFVNPFLATNLLSDDDIPPTLYKIAVKPLGEHSLLNGSDEPRVYRLKSAGKGRYIVTEKIQITGEAGFGIAARDRANSSWFRRGVYSHQLYIDDQLLYYVQLDRAPNDEAQQIGLYYDMELLDRGLGRFEKLYMDSPNALRFYQPRGDTSGIIRSVDFTEGVHTFRIIVSDFNNNRAEIGGLLVLNHPPRFEAESTQDTLSIRFTGGSSVSRVHIFSRQRNGTRWTDRTLTPDTRNDPERMEFPLTRGVDDILKVVAENSWGTRSRPRMFFLRKPDGPSGEMELRYSIEDDIVRVDIVTNRLFTADPLLIVEEGSSHRTVPMTPVDADHYRAAFRPLESYQGVRRICAEAEVNGKTVNAEAECVLYPIVAGTTDTIRFDNGNLVLAYTPTTVYKTTFLTIHKEEYDGVMSYSLEPHRTVLRGPLTVTVSDDRTDPFRGLYFSARGRSSGLVATADTADGRMFFTTRIAETLGEFLIDRDNTPPYITAFRITGASSLRPSIRFGFGDNRSGVEYNDLKMYIDGQIAIPEVDGEHRRASYRPTAPLERGSHLLKIRLRDKMGNEHEVERRFTAG
jgi:hypothetical protein